MKLPFVKDDTISAIIDEQDRMTPVKFAALVGGRVYLENRHLYDAISSQVNDIQNKFENKEMTRESLAGEIFFLMFSVLKALDVQMETDELEAQWGTPTASE